MRGQSLGLIETWGFVPAVVAADAASKAAMVSLQGFELARGGLVTVKLSGDVGAVKAAVTAGSAAAEKVGKVVSAHVIPRPDRQLRRDVPQPRAPGPETDVAPSRMVSPEDASLKETPGVAPGEEPSALPVPRAAAGKAPGPKKSQKGKSEKSERKKTQKT